MADERCNTLGDYERCGDFELGRGEVISTDDLANFPGSYPVYSSSAVGDGVFGKYGRYTFDEELITWSIDGGGRPFHRRKHKFSVTNVCGFLRIKRTDRWHYGYLHAMLEKLQLGIQFDYQMKAHPSVIRDLYRLKGAPIEAQRKIATIRDTLDTAIRQTDAIIAKLKQIKQGLLHDLLTRGIDDNGELRPPQSQAPHLYKQSPLGLIPKEWQVCVFGDTLDHIIDFRGRTPKKLGMDWGGGDILALSANNVQPGAVDVSREAYFGSERLYQKWMTNGALREGDVLLTMEAPLGNVAQIPDSSRYIMSQRVIALRFKPEIVLNDFAFWQMQSAEFQHAIMTRSTGSTATGIQRAELVKLHFRAPPPGEQSLIIRRISSVQQQLEGERAVLDKQLKEKSGLMDDLLTGRVRVTALLEDVAPSAALLATGGAQGASPRSCKQL